MSTVGDSFPYHNTVLLVDEYLLNVREGNVGYLVFTMNPVLLPLLHRYDFPADLIETLIIPLLEMEDDTADSPEDVSMKYGPALQTTIDALAHPNCPSTVLHVACRNANSVDGFARLAAKHPNCDEEDTVYVALKYGREHSRAASLGMLAYKYSWAKGR